MFIKMQDFGDLARNLAQKPKRFITVNLNAELSVVLTLFLIRLWSLNRFIASLFFRNRHLAYWRPVCLHQQASRGMRCSYVTKYTVSGKKTVYGILDTSLVANLNMSS